MAETKERIPYISRIRTVASFAIVVLHTFTMYHMAMKDEMTGTEEYVTRVVPWLMMWAVPCFVMVTGILFLDEKKNLTIGRLLFRYVLRMVIVLLLFTAIFFVLDIWMNKESFSSGDLFSILKKFFTDGSWAHLWYLYLLIGLYLLMPAYRLVAKNAGKEILIYLGIVLLIFLSLIPTWERLGGESPGFYICVSSVFPLYLFLGHMIHRGDFKFGMIMGAILLLAGTVTIIILSRIDFGERQAGMEKLLGNYAFLPVIILSTGAFVLLRGKNGSAGGKMSKVWTFLDKYSFGVYLTHLIYLRFLIKVVKWNPLEYGSFWMLIPVVIAVYALSLVTSMGLKLIPGLKKLL